MELVDTHCHIQSIGLDKGERITREKWARAGVNADQVVAEAVEQAVTRLICVGCDLQDSQLAVDFAQARDNCWASIGIHPHEAQHFTHSEASSKLADFASLATQPKVVSIGECGLDYYYEHSPKKSQIEVLEFQLELAQQKNLPVIFHVRDAFDDFWPIYENYSGVRGVLHSFTDSAENMRTALAKDLYIGVNGIATFAKDAKLLDVYKNIPSDRLLLETDAPFLTPTPYRGSINEPKFVGAVADFLAELRGEDRADLARNTTANARELFGV
jgi:TatD DNase family protein